MPNERIQLVILTDIDAPRERQRVDKHIVDENGEKRHQNVNACHVENHQ